MAYEPNPNLLAELMQKTKDRIGEKLSLLEACPPSFMAEHTSFKTIEEMVDASPLAGKPLEEMAVVLRSGEHDDFVAANSRFSSWRDMYLEGARQEVRRRLKASE